MTRFEDLIIIDITYKNKTFVSYTYLDQFIKDKKNDKLWDMLIEEWCSIFEENFPLDVKE